MAKKPTTRPTFEQACRQYVHRFTMEHVPAWAAKPLDGKYYAPQFISDREWYDSTKFPGEIGHLGFGADCYTTGQTWPVGQWLEYPFRIGHPVAPMPAKPTYDELLDLLDDVSAALDNAVLAHGASMTKEDRLSRRKLARDARAVCDALLRGEG